MTFPSLFTCLTYLLGASCYFANKCCFPRSAAFSLQSPISGVSKMDPVHCYHVHWFIHFWVWKDFPFPFCVFKIKNCHRKHWVKSEDCLGRSCFLKDICPVNTCSLLPFLLNLSSSWHFLLVLWVCIFYTAADDLQWSWAGLFCGGVLI